MKTALYVLVATALITITPFLLTFEKGQDIVRGLFCYSIVVLLLFYLYIRDTQRVLKTKWFLLTLVCVAVYAVAFVDLLNLLQIENRKIGWLWVIPLLTCSISLVLLKSVPRIKLYATNVLLFILLMVHLFMGHIAPSQPIFEFPVIQAIASLTQEKNNRDSIPEKLAELYHVTDSVSVTKFYVDSNRSNVVILIESWGVPIDTNMFRKELNIFGGVKSFVGLHFRMYSRTRTAEREDLLDSTWRDENRRKDSLFIPKAFADKGYKTSFLFGGDSAIQWRYKYIRNVGFQQAFFSELDINDASMAKKIDSLLETVDSTRQLIAWTTRDTRFPISDDAEETERLYFKRLSATLQLVANLAKKNPNVRFIVQGDHEPILSPEQFRAKFYRRWVPYVILN